MRPTPPTLFGAGVARMNQSAATDSIAALLNDLAAQPLDAHARQGAAALAAGRRLRGTAGVVDEAAA